VARRSPLLLDPRSVGLLTNVFACFVSICQSSSGVDSSLVQFSVGAPFDDDIQWYALPEMLRDLQELPPVLPSCQWLPNVESPTVAVPLFWTRKLVHVMDFKSPAHSWVKAVSADPQNNADLGFPTATSRHDNSALSAPAHIDRVDGTVFFADQSARTAISVARTLGLL
jgi:hypothetical protein